MNVFDKVFAYLTSADIENLYSARPDVKRNTRGDIVQLGLYIHTSKLNFNVITTGTRLLARFDGLLITVTDVDGDNMRASYLLKDKELLDFIGGCDKAMRVRLKELLIDTCDLYHDEDICSFVDKLKKYNL